MIFYQSKNFIIKNYDKQEQGYSVQRSIQQSRKYTKFSLVHNW